MHVGPYVGRFAPSPSGPLHLGSLVAALASYSDARVHQGRWLVRIEDVDGQRCKAEIAEHILTTLARCGMVSDGPVIYQSSRSAAYEHALKELKAAGLVFACTCTRREVADSGLAGSDGTPIYPGTCRSKSGAEHGAHSWRLRVNEATVRFVDREAGVVVQDLARAVGDFVVRRADGTWTYQLAVVVDDATQGVTDIVRGADLLDSTARQIYLQGCLGLTSPRTLHVPVVTNHAGEKLSKQTGAAAIDANDPLAALAAAARQLDLNLATPTSLAQFWERCNAAWMQRCASRAPAQAAPA